MPVQKNPAKYLAQAERQLVRRDLHSALRLFNLAEEHGADTDRCAGGRWQCFMLLGELARAWNESDAIHARGAPDPNRLWNGAPFLGKRVMLRSLHGFGDAVQFIRYASLVRQQARHVTVEVAPRLVELMRLFSGIDTVTTWDQEQPAWDLQAELMELPYILRSTLDTIPCTTPYLHLPAALLQRAQARMQQPRPRVGVVWAGGEWNPSRAIPLAQLLPLLARKQASFYSLQGGGENAEWTEVRASYGFEDAADHGEGLLTLAAAIANLDLVITIDTLAAHLAGALGTPVWLLLQREADWRWMLGRTDSPWYRSVRIFRQSVQGDWSSLLMQLSTALDAYSCSHADTIELHARMG